MVDSSDLASICSLSVERENVNLGIIISGDIIAMPIFHKLLTVEISRWAKLLAQLFSHAPCSQNRFCCKRHNSSLRPS